MTLEREGIAKTTTLRQKSKVVQFTASKTMKHDLRLSLAFFKLVSF